MSIGIIAACMALSFGSTTTLAQEAATHGDDAEYFRVVYTAFKPGKSGLAYLLINDHFAPARAAAGLPAPLAVHFHDGEWNAAFHWPMENGPAYLELRVSPDTAAFRAALAEQEGSVEAATKLLDLYNSYVDRTYTSIAHVHPAEGEE